MNHNTSRVRPMGRGGFLRTLGTTLLMAGMVILPSGSAQAITPDVQAQADHYFHCLGLMLTDPEQHAEECLPNNIPNSNKSLSEPSIGSPPPPTKPECGEGEYEEGGQCYPEEKECEEYEYSSLYVSEEIECPQPA